MKDDIRKYARLGLVHHMLYPACMLDAGEHERTLAAFVRRTDIETFDCCLPYDNKQQRILMPLIHNCGKTDIAFATHLFPLRKLSFASPAAHEQAQIRMIVKDMIAQAVTIGATGFLFASGGPPPPEATPAHYSAFADFCRWLCAELKRHGITALLEPFDTCVDKRFLYGPTAECITLIESLRSETDNLQIELDVAHLPLMGESFEQAIRTVAPHLRRVHLGNCVLRNPADPRYGDTHPPIGYTGGEIDVPELTRILRLLLEVSFIRREQRGNLLLEMTPWPGRTADETVEDGFRRLQEAWQNA